MMHLKELSLLMALFVIAAGGPPVRAADTSGAPTKKSASRQGIVVWRLEAKTGVTADDIDSLSGFVASQVELYSEQRVISEADIATIMKGEEKRQQCGGDSSSCIAEIGAALGVPEVVAGDLGRVGDFWILNLRRINVRTAQVIKRSSRQVEGSINNLMRVLPGAVAELFGKQAPAPESAATAPTPVPAAPPTPKAAPEPEAAATTSVTANYPMNPYKKYGYAAFFTGVGLCAFGGVAAWQASVKGKDYEAGDRSAKSASDGWAGAMYAGFGAGGAVMITGIVLWALSPGDKAWAERRKVSFAPVSDGVRAGAMFSVAW